jgi:hypothetical protein
LHTAHDSQLDQAGNVQILDVKLVHAGTENSCPPLMMQPRFLKTTVLFSNSTTSQAIPRHCSSLSGRTLRVLCQPTRSFIKSTLRFEFVLCHPFCIIQCSVRQVTHWIFALQGSCVGSAAPYQKYIGPSSALVAYRLFSDSLCKPNSFTSLVLERVGCVTLGGSQRVRCYAQRVRLTV